MKIFVNLVESNPNLFLSPEKYVWIYRGFVSAIAGIE
jgi:hypothetical protein